MELYLKISAERSDGKQMSAEAVGEELVALVEGESVEVEESTFEVTSAELVAGPKTKGPNIDRILIALKRVSDAYFAEHPIDIDGTGGPDNKTDVDRLLGVLLLDQETWELMQAASLRAYNAERVNLRKGKR